MELEWRRGPPLFACRLACSHSRLCSRRDETATIHPIQLKHHNGPDIRTCSCSRRVKWEDTRGLDDDTVSYCFRLVYNRNDGLDQLLMRYRRMSFSKLTDLVWIVRPSNEKNVFLSEHRVAIGTCICFSRCLPGVSSGKHGITRHVAASGGSADHYIRSHLI